jgi:hypothetical protein
VIPSDGGGGGYTAWDGYDLHTMHAMVQSVTDAEIETSWQQVTAWRKTQELLDSHAGTLITYRQSLVEHWPPETNAASTAFVKYVDDLISSLQQASKAADDNARALSDLTLGVATAKTAVTKAYQEYTANQAKLDAAPRRVAVVSRYAPPPLPPPVAPGRQEQLVRQARQAMTTLAATAVDSNSKMTVPPPYTPPKTGGYDNAQHIDAPSSVTMRPPAVPAPRASASQRSAVSPYLPASPNVAPAPGGGPILTGGVVAPPVLGGTSIVPSTLPIPNPQGTGLSPAEIGGFPPGLGPVPGGRSPSSGSKIGAFGGGAGIGSVTEPLGRAVEGRGIGTSRALVPGGVIGTTPSAGPGVGSGGRAASGTPPRVNPVGGVIGQGGPSGGHSGGATAKRGGRPASTRGVTGGSTLDQPYLPGQRIGKGNHDDESRNWDPDDPWALEQGVAPVLEPGPERSTHDPGPGVIGLDR